jgi:hypothetical protein
MACVKSAGNLFKPVLRDTVGHLFFSLRPSLLQCDCQSTPAPGEVDEKRVGVAASRCFREFAR